MKIFLGCFDYFSRLCGSYKAVSTRLAASESTHSPAPIAMLTGTARKAQEAAKTIGKCFINGQLSSYIEPHIKRVHISPLIGLARGGISIPPPNQEEYLPYP